ncbi:carbamoyltransferase HypF [Albimonas pacifica]|uniref:Carbamoyltransferase HypF n=1 Tax=Albimonas pacifica TaxID=1114924 RepID=A0A1I3IF69_9RHOB|nr:carbamoyltransferase HypF [Albimonas pacifica]SFI46562.1 Hydrogenase maturation protein, carbamoyltransferase HypF [Albimonas pacifica]
MESRRIRVRGQVQGVGFRPFVWQLARRHGVSGEVLNDPEGVLILAAGPALDAFEAALRAEAPPLARVDAIESAPHGFAAPPEGFRIAPSRGAGAETRVAPDAATCPACLAEIRSPGRRQGYAFANCTHCGPRFTILRALPYDRAKTTMAAFPMCPACRAEYEDPADRRFHAQPIACPDCGPRLTLEVEGRPLPGDPIAETARLLREGRIVAIKALGGFHLACDAANPAALRTLRERKRRPAKPFALMGPLETIRRHAHVSEAEAELLMDPAAPVVLLSTLGDGLAPLPAAVAPGMSSLGWMLPATPLHHLLLDAFGGPLVMTSGNLSGEPQAIGDAEARETLGAIADAFLLHDREIARRLDDGVERMTALGPMTLRRARGRAPGTLPLPPGFEGTPQVLACGGQLKSAICLTKNGQALLSHHLGDLDDALTWDEFRRADADMAALFDHRPAAIGCDLHPDFRASRHAAARAEAAALPLLPIQHHHAHLAACLGENAHPLEGAPVAGIVLDGLGLGDDGTVWGGELLLGDYRGFERAAHLRPAPLPGGDGAQREPWRNLLVRLDQAGMEGAADEMLSAHPLALLRQAAARGVNAPLSSSAGRLFDAFASALELVEGAQSYEGEAAMRLEALALRAPAEAARPYPFGRIDDQIDPAPMFEAWLGDRETGASPAAMAMRFHAGLARAFATPARALVESGRACAVALTGGCFQNALLLELTAAALEGLPLMVHRAVPANDGGLAFGQALVAAARALGGGAESG